MIEIPLTQGQVAVIDEVDVHLADYKWFFAKSPTRSGYAARSVYCGGGRNRTVFLHNAIMGLPLNRLEVDHIDGDKLNNRRSNLRIVTKRVNQINGRAHRGEKPKRSRYPGVYFHSRCPIRPWQAKIGINRCYVSLGYFSKQEDAYQAYLKAFIEQEKRDAA